MIYTGRVSSLRRFKEDANEVRAGFECGVGVSNFNDVKVGDILECFKIEKIVPLGTGQLRGSRSRCRSSRGCS